MKRFFLTILVVTGLFFLTGCPEEVGNELDTAFFVKNNLNDSLLLRIYGKNRLPESDSALTQTDIDIIYNFTSNPSLIIDFDSAETREFPNSLSMETILESPIGEHFYLINIDTLTQYNPSTWNGKAGVKRYFLFSLNDFQQINFTMEYP